MCGARQQNLRRIHKAATAWTGKAHVMCSLLPKWNKVGIVIDQCKIIRQPLHVFQRIQTHCRRLAFLTHGFQGFSMPKGPTMPKGPLELALAIGRFLSYCIFKGFFRSFWQVFLVPGYLQQFHAQGIILYHSEHIFPDGFRYQSFGEHFGLG